MIEQDIIDLNFKKEVSDDGYEVFYYYTYVIVNGLTLISNSNDSLEDGGWYIDIFNTETPIRFFVKDEVLNLIKILEKAKI